MSNSYVALKINQPLGDFYLTAIPARVLLDVCAVHPYKRMASYEDGSVDDMGNQRRLSDQRVREISSFLKTQDAVLPGTLIVAANYDDRGVFYSPMIGDDDEIDSSDRWVVNPVENLDNVYKLTIPNPGRKMAALVDGQHRLSGFENQDPQVLDMLLPCAIFIDLPIQDQAYLFATINFNQKPVSKSHTYELYGVDLASEPEPIWTPEKLAVHFSRRLNADRESPLHLHIKAAAIDYSEKCEECWKVSTATIVEGVLALITAHPQEDRNLMRASHPEKRSRDVLEPDEKRRLPLRDFYRSGVCDELLYKIIRNFFVASFDVLKINSESKTTVFQRTAGIQALFCVLKALLQDEAFFGGKDFTVDSWKNRLSGMGLVDFSGFGAASGKDRARIRDAILVAIGLKQLDEVRDQALSEKLRCMIDSNSVAG